ncbi:S1 RNA-binding domain-containing protein [Desulforamulus putei]|uniref:S1 RNA binding domain protein n=1 Tax=Desulforamulus putei DSM 12395 TaxID=1121429 RepID=A0A1M5B958_9FIRM|nr:S1 RNA-binding domain-containing protein [Desulforamulus putei]SHF38950.1 S1 RNA binding domain protein [Desulforamulus putei DSM 12395]
MSLEQGNIVEGVVTSITNFGAFVELPGGRTGLVHISEVAEVYVRDINEFLKVNDKVKVKIISVDPKGKIGLSLKQANPSANRAPRRPKFEPSFEDKLAKFMRESDERLSDLKRQTDSKRGGRGGSRY